MKKYLFIALAALGFAACAEKVDDTNIPKGELEESYIAINLMAADVDTRALEGDTYGYEDGTIAERAVKKAYFFFFDENGNPFNVLGNPATAPNPAPTAVNYLQLNNLQAGAYNPDNDNISDISNAVLVLNTYKGIQPKQIVAVLNWTPENKAYSLEDLRTEIYNNSLGDDEKGYVMTNSVYMGEGTTQIIDATPIAEANIKTSEQDALDNPIEIYVERTAAKVVVTAATEIFQVTDDDKPLRPVGAPERTVYVQLKGWELYNEFNKTNLIKVINPEWTNIGLTWNDAPYYRSYWAQTMSERSQNDSFSWIYTEDSGSSTTYGGGFPSAYGYVVDTDNESNNRNTYTYCGENTLEWSSSNDVRTKVILKGTLVEKTGETTYQPLQLARWYGNEYAGVDDLMKAVASSLAYTLFYKDTEEGIDKYKSIAPGDIQIVHGSAIGASAYEVGFQLTNVARNKQWYLYSSANEYTALGTEGVSNADAANTELAKVKPAVLYTDGDTYYIVDVKHLGKNDSSSEYGIVRNHVYQIDIASIKGYGSPGYSGFEFNIENPVYPPTEDEASYVAARINVLSWKVVKQGVNIETK